MTYDPRVGSIPYRVIAHLESLPRGAEVPSAQLAQIASAEPSSFTAIMGAARQAGAIFARQKGGHPKSPLFWSLVDHSKTNGCAPAVSPAGDGSQTPNGGRVDRPAKAGSVTPQQGANRDASAEQSHGAEGSASPTGRGADGPSARGAAPVLSSRRLDAVVPGAHALAKRAAARADQGATAAAETGSLRIALWSDGELQIRRPGGHTVVFTREETRQIVAYLDSIALDAVREQA